MPETFQRRFSERELQIILRCLTAVFTVAFFALSCAAEAVLFAWWAILLDLAFCYLLACYWLTVVFEPIIGFLERTLLRTSAPVWPDSPGYRPAASSAFLPAPRAGQPARTKSVR